MARVWSIWQLSAAHKGLPGQAGAGRAQLCLTTEPALVLLTLGSALWSAQGPRWWRWGSWTKWCPPASRPADCPMLGQILTRSLGRQASPGPFLLPSGAGTPACRRGSGPGGRQSAWAHWGCAAGARAPVSLVPGYWAGDEPWLSQAGQARWLSLPAGKSPCPPRRRQRAAGALPTPQQELMEHWLCATARLPWAGTWSKSQRGPIVAEAAFSELHPPLAWEGWAAPRAPSARRGGLTGEGSCSHGTAGLGQEDPAAQRGTAGEGVRLCELH